MANAEELDDSASGDKGSAGAGPGEALAAAISAEAVKSDPALTARAALVLDEQIEVLRLQKERLAEERKTLAEEQRLQLSHLRVRRFTDYAKGAMEITIALALLILICGLGALVVQAREAKGLLAEPIKIPPDYAMRGLDGTVLAQEFLDKLNRIGVRASHYDLRSPDKIVGSWTNQTNVLIPTTGISLAELTHLLNDWLGQQTHISGEVVRIAGGVALTVRIENNTAATFTGPESELDALLQKAATWVFKQTQPFDYLASLNQGTDPDAISIVRQLAESGPRDERAYGYLAWAGLLTSQGDFRGAVIRYDQSAELAPDDPYPRFARWPTQLALGHEEAELADAVATVRMLHAAPDWIRPDAEAATVPQVESTLAALTGGFLEAAKLAEVAGNYDLFDYNTLAPLQIADYYAKAHDTAKARAILAANPKLGGFDTLRLYEFGDMNLPSVVVDAANGEWTAAVTTLGSVDREAKQDKEYARGVDHTFVWPWLAYAWARAGHVKSAEELIAMTPLDCTLCLEMRGRIADVSDNTRTAAYWFDRAVKDAPSAPFAMTDWGEMLLRHADYDGAIAQFERAHQKGPHFADPLEMWGEALMQKNRSDLALPKFEEANTYAPSWGRLHLKWGEALWWTGKHDAARQQFALASALDLSAADKEALAHWH